MSAIPTPENAATERSLAAALDLGSNSFHLLLVRPEQGGFTVVERLKEKVQLLAGFENGKIQPEAFERGLACIQRFAQRLKPLELDAIRVMGTYALRAATNADHFKLAVEQIVGVPLVIITGAEEAELIFQAVARSRATPEAAIAIDIGGGSTEIASGPPRTRAAFTADFTTSVEVGCVAFKDRFFAPPMTQSTGYVAAKKAAVDALTAALKDNQNFKQDMHERTVVGTSGTIESVQTVLRANGWDWDVISRDGMDRLENAIVGEQWFIEAGVPGLAPDRVDIFPAGAAILSACFEVLGLSSMRYAEVSLLHGMVHGMAIEKLPEVRGDEDVEVDLAEESVMTLAKRFAVDLAQARRVWRTAERLFEGSQPWWHGDDECRQLLRWAAELHEIGMHVNARHYHRHGSYVLKHADIPGLSGPQQSMLALLVRGHRRSLPGLAFQAFEPELAEKLKRLVALLRVAVILERSHADADSPELEFSVEGNQMHLTLRDDWLSAHPLSARELEVEAGQLANAGLEFSYT